MNSKIVLYIGIFFLVTGIVMRVTGVESVISNILIGLGVVSKLSYLYKKLVSKEYKPGYELLVLYSGLAVFFCGLFLKNNYTWAYAYILLYIGIALKVTFVLLFARKLRKNPVSKR